MKKMSFKTIIIIILFICVGFFFIYKGILKNKRDAKNIEESLTTSVDEVKKEKENKIIEELIEDKMKSFLNNDTTNNGLLFGMFNQETNVLSIRTEGVIEASDELKLACITSKPCISYMVLKEGLDINHTIEKWFPVADGFSKSDQITLKMLMSNSSGIKEYVTLIERDPEYTITPNQAINIAYRNNDLLFEPGQRNGYSNTGFVIVSQILEQVTGKSLNELIEFYFGNIAPSLRLDDGEASYPKGYPEPFPIHWSVLSYAAGFVGTAEDVLISFSFISQQPEFNTMIDCKGAYGLGIFKINYHEFGEAVFYHGNIWGCSMYLIKIDSMIYYFHATGKRDLNRIAYDIIKIVQEN